MGIFTLLVPVVVIAIVALLVTSGGGPFRRLAVTGDLQHSASSATVRVRVRNLVALVSATVVAVALVSIGLGTPSDLGRSILVAPTLAATTAIAVFAIIPGARLREPAGVRAADLVPRAPFAFAPRWLFIIAVSFAVAAVTVVLLLGLAAAGDGRSITVESELTSSTAGPFPGFYYGAPVLAAVLLLVVASVVAVVRIPATARPTDETLRGVDTAIRVISMRVVLRAAIAATSFTLGALLVVAGPSTRSVADAMTDGTNVLRPADPGLLGLALAETIAGFVLVMVGVVFLLWSVRDAVRSPVAIERTPVAA